MLNTPPTYAIYIAGLVFEWLLAQGGVAAIEQRNIAKAKLLYDCLDASAFYASPVRREDRSRMNVPFKLRDESLDGAFLKGAQERGLVQLKGHRSVGGMRASIYNAMPIEGVQALVDYMREFERDTAERARRPELPHPHAQPDLQPRAAPLSGGALHRRQGRRPSRRDHRALARHARDGRSRASVKAIGRAGAGTNNIPVAAMTQARRCRCSTRRARTPTPSRSWCWRRC